MEWTGPGVLAAPVVGCIGYLSRQLHREIDWLRQEIVPRLDRLEERDVRHLEMHAGGHSA